MNLNFELRSAVEVERGAPSIMDNSPTTEPDENIATMYSPPVDVVMLAFSNPSSTK